MVDEYKKMGITIEYVGIASQFRFDHKLQDAITALQSASYDADAAELKLKALKVSRFEAETKIMLAQVAPYEKWDGKSFPNVPSVMISSDSVLAWFKSMVDSFKSPSTK